MALVEAHHATYPTNGAETHRVEVNAIPVGPLLQRSEAQRLAQWLDLHQTEVLRLLSQ